MEKPVNRTLAILMAGTPFGIYWAWQCGVLGKWFGLSILSGIVFLFGLFVVGVGYQDGTMNLNAVAASYVVIYLLYAAPVAGMMYRWSGRHNEKFYRGYV